MYSQVSRRFAHPDLGVPEEEQLGSPPALLGGQSSHFSCSIWRLPGDRGESHHGPGGVAISPRKRDFSLYRPCQPTVRIDSKGTRTGEMPSISSRLGVIRGSDDRVARRMPSDPATPVGFPFGVPGNSLGEPGRCRLPGPVHRRRSAPSRRTRQPADRGELPVQRADRVVRVDLVRAGRLPVPAHETGAASPPAISCDLIPLTAGT